ncbi:MAG: proteasome subunit alpha [Rhodococcus fascians]|uniref:proteasome subunit alpha n=1 Tax=Nocardiaceae TaxID=85025 RepID=UPI00036B19D0|nr:MULTISPECIES: proteasome subunit alpha [Rhodococcus]OZC53840.1 proteasome subunit alpha [Rhodococcus sp. 06-621-2]OZC89239.1 proteasome subunit alpha [Rhodococcus sp. 06-418-1B]OZD05420.1 proteasome subunit alpha [Rhodococcus sp. 06-156-4C]OZD16532.1 proteasome subunit alpha [Rhodococcus sp. 06-156-4a]OZD26390.1 proteasome subunit alpha [Rhodococcus sp. 06-156-3C]
MTMPYYASAEQIMRDRSELARKGIARGRSVIVLSFADGVLFVAENRSSALHKVSELYDRLGFAAVGKYNEFENLRKAGILHADTKGYTYDRRDVTGRSLAKTYAQALGTIFTEQLKPYEVEICVAEVSHSDEPVASQLYRITYDGSIVDEQDFVVMGGTTEPIVTALKESYRTGLDLASAVKISVAALEAGAAPAASPAGQGGTEPEKKVLEVSALEVAVLDQGRPRRAFRRIAGAALQDMLPRRDAADQEPTPGQPGVEPAE